MVEQTERIKTMEQCLERASRAMARLSQALDDFADVQDDISQLSAYYGSDEWKKDFADYEQGLLPGDLKRGVLSEDGVWNLLSDHHELVLRMREIATTLSDEQAQEVPAANPESTCEPTRTK